MTAKRFYDWQTAGGTDDVMRLINCLERADIEWCAIGGVAVNEIKEWQFEDADGDDEKIKQASYTTTSVYGFGHPLYYDNVVKVLQGKAEPDVDGREGLKSLEVLVATYKSSRDGVRIGLPLDL